MTKKKKYTPCSKKNITYARLEAYAFSVALIILVLLDKDVSAISILLSLAWGGYKLLQGLYIKMSEREHLEEIRTGRLRESLTTEDIDEDIEELENEEIDFNEEV